jgi:hypothetical protein
MPTASYNNKAAARGEAARGILRSSEFTAAASKEGTPADKLEAMGKHEQAGKLADQEQRTKQAESKSRQEIFDKDLSALRKEFTVFRQRRETRKAELTTAEKQPLLAILTTEYTRKIQIDRLGKDGKTTTVVEESDAALDRVAEIVNTVGAVLASPELVSLFAVVEYGHAKLSSLKKEGERLQGELKALATLRNEIEAATKREHEAVGALNDLWKLYGPQLRRAGDQAPGIKALLQGT